MAILVLSPEDSFISLIGNLGLGQLQDAVLILTLRDFTLLPILHLPKLNDSVVGRQQLKRVGLVLVEEF